MISPTTHPHLYRIIDIGGYTYYSPMVIGIGVVCKMEDAQRELFKKRFPEVPADQFDNKITEFLNNIQPSDVEAIIACLEPLLIRSENAPALSEVSDLITMSVFTDLMGFFSASARGSVSKYDEYKSLLADRNPSTA